MIKKLALILILITSISFAAEAHEVTEGPSTILSAHQTTAPVFIDGVAEPAWEHASELVVNVKDGSIGAVNVTLMALYDQQYLYILASWSDPTESVGKDIWAFTGKNWTVSGDEDRFAIFWNIDDSISGFNIAGCAMLCHGDRMHTNAPGEKGDLWQWKAGRTNPVGYAEDQWIDNTVVEGYSHLSKEAALRSDSVGSILEALSGGSVRNSNEAENAPLYYKPKGKENFLLWEEVEKGGVVKITNETFEEGFTVPGYFLRRPRGSRDDIDAKGMWRDGKWTLEFRRKLQTEHPDDAQFDVSRTYRFGIAVMDNSGGFQAYGIGHSFDLGARTLEFEGLKKESITQLALIKDYLIIGEAHAHRGNIGLVRSSLDDALILYSEMAGEAAEADSALYLETKRQFTRVKSSLTLEDISLLIGYIDLTTLTLQGKRIPTAVPWDVKLLLFWGKIQVYTLILLAALAVFPLIKVIQVGRKPTFRRLSIFLFIVIVPLLFEGVGRIGMLVQNPALENFSFLTNEYATLLWAWLMLMGLFIARSGFGEVEDSIHSLEFYSIQLEEDIKQRERLEKELRRSEEKYRGLFEHSQDGVADISSKGDFITTNEAAARMLGYTKDELKGLSLMDLVLNIDEGQTVISKLEKEGYLKDHVLTLKAKNGDKVIVSISGRRIEEESRHIRSEAIFRDITERVRADEERHALEQQLTQTERLASIGKLAAGVAHEINNPLTNIMLASEKLVQMDFKKEVQEKLDIIMRNVNAAATIARNLLIFSRKTSPVLAETDIVEVISSSLELLSFRMKNVKLSVDLEGIPKIYVDAGQMQQVFTNILINAIQAMPQGGELRIYCKKTDDHLQLNFEDTGAGIPEEHLDRIFDPFYTTKEIGSGTGLGLSICYGIVKAHNGDIRIDSKVGEGTKVIITLPFAKKINNKERRR